MATMNERQLVQDICYMISFDQLTDVDVKASLMSITNRGRSHWSISPLVVAVRKHRMDLVQMMILKCDFDVNATVATSSSETLFSHPDCWCPLSTAVEIENEELIRFLGVTCSANPNILNPNQTSGHRSVLQLAIAKGNPVLVKQLIEEMGADVNMALSLNEDWSKSYTALHSAMVLDIYNDNWDLMQTKILLEKGGNLNTMATWNDNCQLGIGTKTGTAIEFAFELRTHFRDRKNTEYLVTLIKLNKKIVELTNDKKNLESNNEINFQEMLEQHESSIKEQSLKYQQECETLRDRLNKLHHEMKDKEIQLNGLRSEKETANHMIAEQDRRAQMMREEIQTLRNTSPQVPMPVPQQSYVPAQHVQVARQAPTPLDYMWTMATAVSNGEIKKVKSLLENCSSDVNIGIPGLLGPYLDGPVLLSAIHNFSEEIILALVQKYGAKINQEIYWEGKQSSMIIYAMVKAINENNLRQVELLLDLGADLNQKGWMKMDGRWAFGMPLESILYFRTETSPAILQNMINLLITKHEKHWNKMKLTELVEEISEKFQWNQGLESIMAKKIQIISGRLSAAKSIHKEINNLRLKPAYMTEEEMAMESRGTREKLLEPLKIIKAIEDLKMNPDYMDEEQIQILRSKVEGEESRNRNPDLECTVCKEMPTNKFGATNNVYSCFQDHLLCQKCLERLEMCPACKQTFQTSPPKRNFLAERMIAQIVANKRDQQSDDDDLPANLPEEVAESLRKIRSSTIKRKSNLQRLEERLARARKLQEQKICLQSMTKFIPMDEIEMIQRKSEAKIEDARLIHKVIFDLQREPLFMKKEEIKMFSQMTDSFKTKIRKN